MAKIILPPFAPTSRRDLEISGALTVADWSRRRGVLQDAAPDVWEAAFDDFFQERLDLRYLNPIAMLQDNGTYRGEGFSIVAIQVTLIEFLAASIAGVKYRYVKRGDPALGAYEYSQSGQLFANFLSTEAPFSAEFSASLADEFYRNVRCGLLHEARTKQGWSIWAESGNGQFVDGGRRIVFRNDLQRALARFFGIYRGRVSNEACIQEAFVRKIDSLCME